MHTVGYTSKFLLQRVILIGWMAASVLGCIPHPSNELWPNRTLLAQSQNGCEGAANRSYAPVVRCGEYYGCCCCYMAEPGWQCIMGGLRAECCHKCFDYPPNRVPTECSLFYGAPEWCYCDPECCCANPECARRHGNQFKCERYKFSPVLTSTALCKPPMSACSAADLCCAYGDWPGNCAGGTCAGLQSWAPCTSNAECWSGHCTAVVGSYGGRCDFGATGSFCNKTDSGSAYCKSGTCGADAENPNASYGKCA